MIIISMRGFAVVRCSVPVKASADAVWKIVGGFGDAGVFVGVACKVIAGDGDIGSIRAIGDHILEAMVGATSHSYSYVQTEGPMAQYSYHGTVAVGAVDASNSVLNYTLVFDPTAMEEGQADREIARLQGRFQGAVDKMRDAVEAQLIS